MKKFKSKDYISKLEFRQVFSVSEKIYKIQNLICDLLFWFGGQIYWYDSHFDQFWKCKIPIQFYLQFFKPLKPTINVLNNYITRFKPCLNLNLHYHLTFAGYVLWARLQFMRQHFVVINMCVYCLEYLELFQYLNIRLGIRLLL